MIIRVKKSPGNFVIIHKAALIDERLSWKAKGLFSYVMTLPDDWTIRTTDLSKRSDDGISSVRSAIKELFNAGYITRDVGSDARGNSHGDGNRFSGTSFVFHETPVPVQRISVQRLSVYGKTNATNNIETKSSIEGSAEKTNESPTESRYTKFARRWYRIHFRENQELYPSSRRDRLPAARDLKSSSVVLERIERIDGYDWSEQIKPSLKWAARNSFWATNLRSLASLRGKGRNGATKFENIYSSMIRERSRGSIARSGKTENEQCGKIERVFEAWSSKIRSAARRSSPAESVRTPSPRHFLERWKVFSEAKREKYSELGYSIGANTFSVGGRLWNEFANEQSSYWNVRLS